MQEEVWAEILCRGWKDGKSRILTDPSPWVMSRSVGGYAFEKVVWLVCSACLCRERMTGEDGIAVEMGMRTSP